MQIVIDISEKTYNAVIDDEWIDSEYINNIIRSIKNGTPIVQCKECDYWEKSENSLQGRCCLLQMYPTGAWFCGNAKLKGENNG